MLAGVLATLFEQLDDCLPLGQVLHVVTTLWMSFQGEYLTVDAEAADVMFGTVLEGRLKCLCIFPTESRQFLQGGGPFHLAVGFDCGIPKFDWFFQKLTTESQSDR